MKQEEEAPEVYLLHGDHLSSLRIASEVSTGQRAGQRPPSESVWEYRLLNTLSSLPLKHPEGDGWFYF